MNYISKMLLTVAVPVTAMNADPNFLDTAAVQIFRNENPGNQSDLEVALGEAIRTGNLETAKVLLDKKNFADQKTQLLELLKPMGDGMKDPTEVIADLLYTVDIASAIGRLPGPTLGRLVLRSDLDMVTLLVDNGADVNHEDLYLLPPLRFVIGEGLEFSESPRSAEQEENSLKIANLLIDKKANVNRADGYGYTLLHIAASLNKLELAKILINKKASVNHTDMCGKTALFGAAENKHWDMVDLLINSGADVDHVNKYGQKANLVRE